MCSCLFLCLCAPPTKSVRCRRRFCRQKTNQIRSETRSYFSSSLAVYQFSFTAHSASVRCGSIRFGSACGCRFCCAHNGTGLTLCEKFRPSFVVRCLSLVVPLLCAPPDKASLCAPESNTDGHRDHCVHQRRAASVLTCQIVASHSQSLVCQTDVNHCCRRRRRPVGSSGVTTQIATSVSVGAQWPMVKSADHSNALVGC